MSRSVLVLVVRDFCGDMLGSCYGYGGINMRWGLHYHCWSRHKGKNGWAGKRTHGGGQERQVLRQKHVSRRCATMTFPAT